MYEAILCSCSAEGTITPAYIQLLETEVSEALYHLEIFVSVQKRINKQSTTASNTSSVELGNIEYEEIKINE